MKIEAKKKLLLSNKLVAEDFYETADGHLVIRRTGIDKLELVNEMRVQITSITTVPYGSKVCTTILAKGSLKDMNPIETVSSANPDNCRFPNYAEVALKRVRHRLLLMLLDLYKHGIFSDEESDTFQLLNIAGQFKANQVADEARRVLKEAA